MNVIELVGRLASIGATARADGDQVAVQFPEKHLREVQELGLEIQRLKPELLRALVRQRGQPHFVEPVKVVPQVLLNDSDADLEEVPVSSVPAKCPPLPPGVRLVKYAPKAPPVAVAPISIVNDVDKFMRNCLEELDARLHHPVQIRAGGSVFEILSKLAEVGLELTLEWSPREGK